jgi:predicted dehydrogenase
VAREPLTAAVVGIGYWGPNLARNFSASDEFRLVGLCDSNPVRLKKAVAHYPAATATENLDDLLATKPDLVAIAIPVAAHYEVARRCLEAGCHVLVEKPLTATVEEGEKLLALGDRVQRKVFVDHTFLFTSAVEEMKRQVESGSLGEMLYVDSVRINLGLFQPDVDVIWDLAPHDLSILQHLLGRPPKTVAAMGSSHNPGATVDVAYLHLDYGAGLTVHLHLSWLSPVKVRRMIFAGAKQSLIFDDLDQDMKIKLYNHGVAFDVADLESRREVLVSYRKGEMRAPAISPKEALAVEIHEIAQDLRGELRSRSTGVDGLKVVRVLEAATASLRLGGSPVRLEPLVPPALVPGHCPAAGTPVVVG